ncbi:MAG: PIN domain-containing protein [Proteobacteria bacterium]|nr:PIN domain-containing protein [Pseudomonadota bacterium]MBU1570922.1 PIN domain-containing protein [Pseudomonadota bacterium]
MPVKLPPNIIDANVILRFFLGDDEKQLLKARAFFQKTEFDQEEALLTEIVFAEVIWVLQKVYSIPRKEIAEKFSRPLAYKGIKTILNKEIFLESLRQYPLHVIDIQDIFLAVLSKKNNSTVITFDKTDFKKLDAIFSEP